MAQKSRPDPANGNALTADEYEGIGSSWSKDGVIGTPADAAVVYADSTGRQVKVRAGKMAMVRGYEWFSDPVTEEIINNGGAGLPANTSGLPRIDRLVLRLDRTARTVRTQYLQGTAAAQPNAPALTQTAGFSAGVFDVSLARWTVAAGYTTVAPADVTIEHWYPQPSGVVLCNSTSRPFGASLYEGLEIYEFDTKVYRRWDAATWPMSKPWRKVVALTATQGSVTFSGIPTWLKNLKLTVSARGDTANTTQDLYMQINGDAGSNYFGIRRKITNATETISNYATSGVAQVGFITGSSAGGGRFGNCIVEFAGWEVPSKPLDAMYRAAAYPSGATSMYEDGSMTYNTPTAYTSIKLLPFAGNFVAGSSFVLEGWD